MKEMKHLFSQSRLLKPLIALYFFVALVEIVAEYYKDMFYISVSKPLLMPVLIAIYLCASKDRNKTFIISLIAVWIANLFFISSAMSFIIIGTLFFLVYRILVILLVMRMIKFPGYIPMILGCLPFLFIYLFVANITYYELANRFFLFVIQGLFMILFGGFCLGNYIIKSNTSNTYLLISTMLFTATQFILVIKLYYLNINIFQSLAMLLFVAAQYLLCKFMLLEEKKKKRYMIINQAKLVK